MKEQSMQASPLNQEALENAIEEASQQCLPDIIKRAVLTYIASLPKEDRLAETLELNNGQIRMDIAEHRVYFAAKEVHLTPREFDLLRCFLTHRGRLLTQADIVQEVWPGRNPVQFTHAIRVHIQALRSKIEPNPSSPLYITTEPRRGYRMEIVSTPVDGTGHESAQH